MRVDFCQNTLITNKHIFHLDGVRQWLLKNYPDLCNKLFIKMITIYFDSKNHKRMSYDWDTIFFLAQEAGYLDRYVNETGDNLKICNADFICSNGNIFKIGDKVHSDMFFLPEEDKNFNK